MAGITNPIVSTAEVQTITVDATGGTFTVTWNGATTSALAFNVSAATFTTEMDAITDDAGDCVVTGGPGAAGGGTPYTLTWAAKKGNVPAPTTDATSLTGGAGTAAVATSTAGVSALADPWLSVGAHVADPCDPRPGRLAVVHDGSGGVDGGRSMDGRPRQRVPGHSAGVQDAERHAARRHRQELKDYLVVAPDGVIDTVDAGKETTRKLMCTDWLVRTFLPLWFDAAGMTDEADAAALPSIVSALNADETIAVVAAAGMAARAVSDYAWSDLDWASLPGDGRADHPITGDFFPFLWPDPTTDYDFDMLDTAQRCARGAAYSSGRVGRRAGCVGRGASGGEGGGVGRGRPCQGVGVGTPRGRRRRRGWA